MSMIVERTVKEGGSIGGKTEECRVKQNRIQVKSRIPTPQFPSTSTALGRYQCVKRSDGLGPE